MDVYSNYRKHKIRNGSVCSNRGENERKYVEMACKCSEKRSNSEAMRIIPDTNVKGKRGEKDRKKCE